MRRTRHSLLVVGVSVFAILIASVAFAAPSRPQKPMLDRPAVATELATVNQLALETSAPFDKAVLTVSGPKDFKIRKEFAAGQAVAVDLAGADFADGRYRYTLRVSPKTDRGAVKMGVFFVDNGEIISRDSKRSQLDAIRGRLNMSRRQKVQEAAAKLGSKLEQRPGSRPTEGLRSSRSEPRVAPSPGGIPPYYYGGLFGGYVGIFGYGPLLYFYEIPYGLPGPAGYYPPYGMTGFMMQYYGNNYRFSQYANYDYAYYNIHSGIYNINLGYGNYNYGYYNYDYGIFNVRYAGFVNADIGYLNYRYALYGANISIAYGLSYDGYSFYGGYNLIAGAGYDLYNYSPAYSFMYVGPNGVGVNTLSPANSFHLYNGSLRVERGDGVTPNIRFSSLDSGQRWLLQNNVSLGVFALRDETGGASPFRVWPGAPENGLAIEADGSLTTSTGAFLSAGGVWTDASSRDLKEDIRELTLEEAQVVLAELDPVKFKYRGVDERHVGFIAEDVPELVATAERNGISAMDIVAVLTEVVQYQQQVAEHQQQVIEALNERLEKLEKGSRGH